MNNLNLQDIKGSYDAVFSLGSACNPALQFQRLNLKRFTSSPLDWSYSPYLSDVNRLLKNNFKGFMELKNMRVVNDKGDSIYANYANDGAIIVPHKGIHAPPKSYVIQDTLYNIFSAHDFPIIVNQSWLVTYPSFKKTLNYRIYRFLEKVKNSQSVLFVRFNILILNPVEELQEISEVNWELDRVCAVNVPDDPNSNSTWDYVLKGVTLTN
jgi:hypothetical protein